MVSERGLDQLQKFILPKTPASWHIRFPLALISILLAVLAPSNAVFADSFSARTPGLHRDVEFSDYTPLASAAYVVTRLLSPLNGLRVKQRLVLSGYSLDRQSVGLKNERFTVYIPAVEPPQGFALLVFLPPWQDARVPAGWNSTLEQNNTIFVTPQHAGNSESVLDRRVPLVLLAAHNIALRYHVDAQRVYVAGFSGGSRIALRIALGYPDIFRGALLNAGSDPIGNSQMPLPGATLFYLFQSSSRLQYLTGEDDATNVDKDSNSVQSMRRWCVFNTGSDAIFRTGHDVATSSALQLALIGFAKNSQIQENRLAACRGRVDGALHSELHRVETEIGKGHLPNAQKLLDAIDALYGGLAAPRSEELENEIVGLGRASR